MISAPATDGRRPSRDWGKGASFDGHYKEKSAKPLFFSTYFLSLQTNYRIMKHTLTTILLLVICLQANARIDRQAVVARNNPKVSGIDALSSLTVGNGGFAFTVDATGLQTFPETYSKGVPLGTMSDWGWHSFPNTENYQPEEALDDKRYAVEKFTDERRKAAANYLRANPHRLHLGTIGFDIQSPRSMSGIKQELLLWTGCLQSSFSWNGSRHQVKTACDPVRDLVAVSIQGSAKVAPVLFRFPYPTGAHSDDACDWNADDKHSTVIVRAGEQQVLLKRTLDETVYYVDIRWEGKAHFQTLGRNRFRLTPHGKQLAFTCEYRTAAGTVAPKDAESVFQAAAAYWTNFWQTGGIADFGRCSDPRAKELERRVVLSQYLLAVNCAGCTPPQETGLTYNSWFGKYHLEMIWWHQAQFALWGHPELLERSLNWYFRAEPMAREIARRQGYKGIRWMKMTDPSSGEAPSKVGSYLIWQQPHLIYLTELLRRAGRDISRYRPLIEETARFMTDYAQQSTKNAVRCAAVSPQQRHALRGCIPAQETLSASSTVDPPFELAYWQWALKTAGHPLQMDTLAHQDGLYLAAADATDTYTNIKYISDHPAVLGAYGIIPDTGLFDKRLMQHTLDWIWDGWNWDKTWGWDYPMVAMCAARLGDRRKAVDALLMDRRTNTYLVSGHNYQDERLRLYLPGNGGLLAAVALMCAGWDGCQAKNPGFPEGWNVAWEGLLPLP